MSRSQWSERRRFLTEEAPIIADPVLGLGNKDRVLRKDDHRPEEVRTRVPRPRVTIDRCFEPVLTVRQKTIVKKRARARVAASWGRMLKHMRDTDMTMKEFVGTLSNEELARGQLKDAKGGFQGRPPEWVPREFHQECLRELFRRGKQLWMENYVDAIKAMTDIATGRGAGQYATPGERFRAAQFVIERLEGKVPDKVVITAEDPWQAAIEGIVAEVSPEQIAKARRKMIVGDQADIIDGEVINEEPEPDPIPPKPAYRHRRR